MSSPLLYIFLPLDTSILLWYTYTMKEYKCTRCGETNLEKFYTSKTYRTKNRCKSCMNKERVIQHRNSPKSQERQARYYKKWYAENGRKRESNYTDVILLWHKTNQDKVKIGLQVRGAIKRGLLERPLTCEICGRTNCRINAHHKDYDLPFDVMWICSSCHKKIHSSS